MLTTVSRTNVNKNIIGLKVTVGKKVKSASMKKAFLRGMHLRISILLVIRVQGLIEGAVVTNLCSDESKMCSDSNSMGPRYALDA